jgi:hypothetical protein
MGVSILIASIQNAPENRIVFSISGVRDCAIRAVAEFDIVQPPSNLFQERRALRRSERGREFTQERELLVGQVKCIHWRMLSSVGVCTFERRHAGAEPSEARRGLLKNPRQPRRGAPHVLPTADFGEQPPAETPMKWAHL